MVADMAQQSTMKEQNQLISWDRDVEFKFHNCSASTVFRMRLLPLDCKS